MRCGKCGGELEPSILDIHFPVGTLPVKGLKCSRCGDELILPDEARRGQELAEKLGLYGAVNPLTRKITKCGTNLAIYIPKEFERQLSLEKGTPIKLWLQKDQICIKPS